MTGWKVCSVVAVAVAATVTSSGVAEARIVCRDGYQVVGAQLLSTPYCQDAYLAAVAQEYGMRVSAAAVRRNPSVKAQACRLVAYDNRVQTACAGYRPSDNRYRF